MPLIGSNTGAALRTLVIGASSSIDNCANGFSG